MDATSMDRIVVFLQKDVLILYCFLWSTLFVFVLMPMDNFLRPLNVSHIG
jgi:hypothetical protein